MEKRYLCYLADIFEKLNMLNKQLQGRNKLLIDVKAKIFGFISLIELWQQQPFLKKFDQFHWLKIYEPTDAAVLVILDHLRILATDFQERFSDLIFHYG